MTLIILPRLESLHHTRCDSTSLVSTAQIADALGGDLGTLADVCPADQTAKEAADQVAAGKSVEFEETVKSLGGDVGWITESSAEALCAAAEQDSTGEALRQEINTNIKKPSDQARAEFVAAFRVLCPEWAGVAEQVTPYMERMYS